MAKARALARLVGFLAGRILGLDRTGRLCGGGAFIYFACKLHNPGSARKKNFLPGLPGRLSAVSVPHPRGFQRNQMSHPNMLSCPLLTLGRWTHRLV